MTRSTWKILCAGLALAVTATAASAQSPTVPRSTLDGVFTAAQAAAGGDVYAGACTGCHTRASHAGVAFRKSWNGMLVFDLYDFISQTMPQDNPGGLSPGEYALVVAYLLEMNGMPAGSDPLPSDPAALKQIRIDSAGAGSDLPDQAMRLHTSSSPVRIPHS